MAGTRKLPMGIASEASASGAAPVGAQVLRLSEFNRAAERPAQKPAAAGWKAGESAGRRAKWSPRATLAVSGGVALLLWGLVALAASALH